MYIQGRDISVDRSSVCGRRGISDVYKINNSGPNSDTCGTPTPAGPRAENSPRRFTWNVSNSPVECCSSRAFRTFPWAEVMENWSISIGESSSGHWCGEGPRPYPQQGGVHRLQEEYWLPLGLLIPLIPRTYFSLACRVQLLLPYWKDWIRGS